MNNRTNSTTAALLPWHTYEASDALHKVSSSEDGLTQENADQRIEKFGANRLRPAKKKGPLARFLLQFHNVLIYVLLVACVVTALLGHWVDSGVIFGVVVINAIIGFIQEGKAEKALDAIRNMLSHHAMVKRNGIFISVPADQLVPGDIVLLQSGDKVPADLRMIRTRELRIDEAILTGESVPVDKIASTVSEQATIGDRKCLAYSGTLVTYGQGQGVVVETGDRTEIGRISGLLREVQTLTTPFYGKWLCSLSG